METLWWRRRRKHSSERLLLLFTPTMPFAASPAHSMHAPSGQGTSPFQTLESQPRFLDSTIFCFLMGHAASSHIEGATQRSLGVTRLIDKVWGPPIFSGHWEVLGRKDSKTTALKWHLDPMVTVDGISLCLSRASNSLSGGLALFIQLHVPLHGRKERGTKELLDEGERGEWKSWLKTQTFKKLRSWHPVPSLHGK